MKTILCLFLSAALGLAQHHIDGPLVVTGAQNYCADAGSTDAYACSLAKTITAYQNGTRYIFKANTSNTGAATLNLNTIGAVSLVKYVGGAAQALEDNDIRAGGTYEVLYDGTDFQVLSVLGNGGTTYTLPTATADTLGGAKVGPGLSIDGSGILSASGSGTTCDPGDPTMACLVEEFMTGTGTSGQIGTYGWKFAAVTSGTFGLLNVGSTNQVTQHPGVATLTSTTTANSGGVLNLSNTSTTAVVNLDDLVNEEWEVAWIAKIDSTTDTRFRVGMSVSAASIVPSTGEATFMIRYDTDAAFADNTKNTTGSWVAQFCGYNSGACANTSGVYAVFNITPDTNWHRFRIYRSGTTINFQIDAGTPRTMCASGCDMTTPSVTSPSSQAVAPWTSFGISGSTQRKVFYDWAMFKMTGLTRY